MNPYLILVGVVAWGASIAATGTFAYQAGQDNITAFNSKSEQIVRETLETAQQGAAAAIAANRPRNVTIRQETEREIRENTVYADCRLTDGVRRNINEALTGRAEPAGGVVVPGAVAAK